MVNITLNDKNVKFDMTVRVIPLTNDKGTFHFTKQVVDKH